MGAVAGAVLHCLDASSSRAMLLTMCMVSRSAGVGYSYPCFGDLLAEEAIELLRQFYATGNPNGGAMHRPMSQACS